MRQCFEDKAEYERPRYGLGRRSTTEQRLGYLGSARAITLVAMKREAPDQNLKNMVASHRQDCKGKGTADLTDLPMGSERTTVEHERQTSPHRIYLKIDMRYPIRLRLGET